MALRLPSDLHVKQADLSCHRSSSNWVSAATQNVKRNSKWEEKMGWAQQKQKKWYKNSMRTFRPRPKKKKKCWRRVSQQRSVFMWAYGLIWQELVDFLGSLKCWESQRGKMTLWWPFLALLLRSNSASTCKCRWRSFHTHTQQHIYTHTYIHTYICIYTYKHIHTHTHTVYGACLELKGAIHPQSVRADIQWGRPNRVPLIAPTSWHTFRRSSSSSSANHTLISSRRTIYYQSWAYRILHR